MAGERTLPGIGIKGFYTVGTDYEPDFSNDLLKLSVFGFSKVESRTTSLSGLTPTQGDLYIVPSADANGDDIAAYDDGAWVYLTPWKPLRMYVDDEETWYEFDGTDWQALDRVTSLAGLTGDLTASAVKTALGIGGNSPGTFLSLSDTPASFGSAGQIPVINSGGNALEWSSFTGYTTETAIDDVAAALTEGTNITITYDDGAGTITIDAAGGGGGVTDHGALTGLGDDDHTQYLLADGSRNVTAVMSYSASITPTADADIPDKKYVDDTVAAGGAYTDEQAQDAAALLFTSGTHSGISFSYDDANGQIDATVSASGSIAVEDDATSIVASATTLNFTGSGVTVTDAGSGQADVAIAGGSGSSWSLITSNDFGTSSGTSITATGIDSYTKIVVMVEGINGPSDVILQVLLSEDNGSTYETGSSYYFRITLSENTEAGGAGNRLVSSPASESTGDDLNGIIHLEMMALSTAPTICHGAFLGDDLGGVVARSQQFSGFTTSPATHDAIEISELSGNTINTGTIKIFGIS